MSSSPHYLYGYRNGIKAGNQTIVDGMIHDGLWDSFGTTHMGGYAEYTAAKAGVSRQDQDQYAYESQMKAVPRRRTASSPRRSCRSKSRRRAGRQRSRSMRRPRKDTTLEGLAKLKPAFQKDGSVTPGNAPGLNDGASALIVTSLAVRKANGLKPLAKGHRVRDRRWRAQGALLRADPRGAEPDEEGRHQHWRLRPDRGQ
jgi:acetyl-CoA C-acetyltransferase